MSGANQNIVPCRTLKHVAQYSPLLSENVKRQIQQYTPQQPSLKSRFQPDQLPLSELPSFISGKCKLDVPVYTVWGACEDVRVLEKFRSGEYKVDKLHIIDEASSRLLDVGGIKLRLLGLGGAVVMHKLFDNGEGRTTIAGGQGTMWTTLLQMGELVDTANRVYDPTETRVFITHASPAREGLLNQLSVTLKADFSISAGLHFRYGSSYNEFSVNPTLDHYRGKLAASKASFNDVWETVKNEVEPAVAQNDAQQTLLTNALDIVQKMPNVANGGNPFGGSVPGQGAGGQVDESAFKNMWNFNLADATFGYLILEIEAGRIGTEMRAQGFNFAHRGTGGKHVTQPVQNPVQPGPTSAVLQSATNASPAPTPPIAQVPTGPAQTRPQVAPAAPSSQQTSQTSTQTSTNQPGRPQPAAVQSQQSSKAPAGPSRSAPSPAPVVPSQVKPATPQPSSTNVNMPPPPSTDKQSVPPPTTDARNGTAPQKANATPINKPASPAAEKKPSTGLFIHNLDNEEAVRAIFSEEDKAKISRVEKHGKSNHVVHFNTHEEAQAALDHQPVEHKRGSGPQTSGPRKPNVKWYDDRGGRSNYTPRDGQGNQGAGAWQASNRGGAGAGQRAGYQSGASDSEGGRGRGGYGRGRGRGGDRGGRGGRGAGRGNYNKATSGGEESSATTPAASTPAAAPTNDTS